MIDELIKYCQENGYRFEKGRNWCDCVDYTTYLRFEIRDEHHTLFELDDGGYRLDNKKVATFEEVLNAIH